MEVNRLKPTFFTITLLVVSLSGCVTLVSKSKYPVTINSTPEGANITDLLANFCVEKLVSGL